MAADGQDGRRFRWAVQIALRQLEQALVERQQAFGAVAASTPRVDEFLPHPGRSGVVAGLDQRDALPAALVAFLETSAQGREAANLSVPLGR